MARLAKLTRLLKADPNYPFVLYGIAQEHALAGRTAEAVTVYDRCIAADPSYSYCHKARALGAGGQGGAALDAARAGVAAAKAAGYAKELNELSGLVYSL